MIAPYTRRSVDPTGVVLMTAKPGNASATHLDHRGPGWSRQLAKNRLATTKAKCRGGHAAIASMATASTRPDLLTARRHQVTGDRTNGDTDLP